ncbi:uncharacterized protein LOC133384465 [Rhineura floridana]|uniref:uncharacterized protein LOC133384465 n=1 Tax=Rhineura floridana TaxID=261503 RepID=UPI002AC84ACA|nr:uncharacterized protein LOC133384465 [Rhineura floridana]
MVLTRSARKALGVSPLFESMAQLRRMRQKKRNLQLKPPSAILTPESKDKELKGHTKITQFFTSLTNERSLENSPQDTQLPHDWSFSFKDNLQTIPEDYSALSLAAEIALAEPPYKEAPSSSTDTGTLFLDPTTTLSYKSHKQVSMNDIKDPKDGTDNIFLFEKHRSTPPISDLTKALPELEDYKTTNVTITDNSQYKELNMANKDDMGTPHPNCYQRNQEIDEASYLPLQDPWHDAVMKESSIQRLGGQSIFPKWNLVLNPLKLVFENFPKPRGILSQNDRIYHLFGLLKDIAETRILVTDIQQVEYLFYNGIKACAVILFVSRFAANCVLSTRYNLACYGINISRYFENRALPEALFSCGRPHQQLDKSNHAELIDFTTVALRPNQLGTSALRPCQQQLKPMQTYATPIDATTETSCPEHLRTTDAGCQDPAYLSGESSVPFTFEELSLIDAYSALSSAGQIEILNRLENLKLHLERLVVQEKSPPVPALMDSMPNPRLLTKESCSRGRVINGLYLPPPLFNSAGNQCVGGSIPVISVQRRGMEDSPISTNENSSPDLLDAYNLARHAKPTLPDLWTRMRFLEPEELGLPDNPLGNRGLQSPPSQLPLEPLCVPAKSQSQPSKTVVKGEVLRAVSVPLWTVISCV